MAYAGVQKFGDHGPTTEEQHEEARAHAWKKWQTGIKSSHWNLQGEMKIRSTNQYVARVVDALRNADDPSEDNGTTHTGLAVEFPHTMWSM